MPFFWGYKKHGLPYWNVSTADRVFSDSALLSVYEEIFEKVDGMAQTEKHRLVYQINEKRMTAEKSEESDALFEKRFWKLALDTDAPDISTGKKEEHPGEKREVIGRYKFVIGKTEHKQKFCTVP